MPGASHYVTRLRLVGVDKPFVWLTESAKPRFTTLLSPPGDTDSLRLVGVSFFLLGAAQVVGLASHGAGSFALSNERRSAHNDRETWPAAVTAQASMLPGDWGECLGVERGVGSRARAWR